MRGECGKSRLPGMRRRSAGCDGKEPEPVPVCKNDLMACKGKEAAPAPSPGWELCDFHCGPVRLAYQNSKGGGPCHGRKQASVTWARICGK